MVAVGGEYETWIEEVDGTSSVSHPCESLAAVNLRLPVDWLRTLHQMDEISKSPHE